MTRVHEEYGKTGDNDHAIRVGIQESGPVIVAAALIMFSVFFAFVFQEDQTIKSIGVSLSFGVLFDAFIVRMTLIPALTKLFGHASWYLPKWLQRVLPKIDVEGKALEPVYATEGDVSTTAQDRTSTSNHNENQVGEEHRATEQSHDVRQTSTDHPENIDYEATYTQSTNDANQSSMDPAQHSHEASEVDQQAQSSGLYQALATEAEDDDILFNALMLYARQHQPEVYNQYLRKLQTLRNELYDELNRKS